MTRRTKTKDTGDEMKQKETEHKSCFREVKIYDTYKWYYKKWHICICGKEGYYCDECSAYEQGKLEERKRILEILNSEIEITKDYSKTELVLFKLRKKIQETK